MTKQVSAYVDMAHYLLTTNFNQQARVERKLRKLNPTLNASQITSIIGVVK